MKPLTPPNLAALLALALAAGVTPLAFSAPNPDADVPPKPVRVPIHAVRKVRMAPSATKRGVALRKAKSAAPSGVLGVVIDEPNTADGTLSVVTERDEFATIVAGAGTRITRGYALAGLRNIHTGYTVRCTGAWDRDGFQYQASRIALGGTLGEVAVVDRVNAACRHIESARRGGGFGQALVAMVPPSGLPKAVSIGGQPYPTPSPSVAPIPASDIPVQGAQPAPPMNPAPVPANTVPMTNNGPMVIPGGTTVPTTTPTMPGTPVTPTPTQPGNVPVP